jgi:hypothetical protein
VRRTEYPRPRLPLRSLLQIFRKPTRAAAILNLHSEAEAVPTGGLVMVEGWVMAGEDEAAGPVTVRATVAGAAAKPYDIEIPLSREAHKLWFAVHGHLLPDGPAKLKVDVLGADGTLLGERTLTLRLRNQGELARQVAASLKASGVPLIVGVCDSTARRKRPRRTSSGSSPPARPRPMKPRRCAIS